MCCYLLLLFGKSCFPKIELSERNGARFIFPLLTSQCFLRRFFPIFLLPSLPHVLVCCVVCMRSKTMRANEQPTNHQTVPFTSAGCSGSISSGSSTSSSVLAASVIASNLRPAAISL